MENIKKTFSRIGISYLTLKIIAIASQLILVILISNTIPKILLSNDFLTILGALTQYIIPLPILYFLIKKIKSTPPTKNTLSLKIFLIYICITISLMYVGNFIGLGITQIISFYKQGDVVNPIVDVISNNNIFLNLFLISIIAPIFEEIFFRKLLIDRTIKYGAGISILISALMFGLFHGNLNQFTYSFLLGGFFAAIYVKTGNVIYPIILHMSTNILGSVINTLVGNLIAIFNNTPPGIAITVTYFAIMFIMVFIGLYYIVKWSGKLKNLKSNIQKQIKPSLLNVGMIIFIVYFVFNIVRLLIV